MPCTTGARQAAAAAAGVERRRQAQPLRASHHLLRAHVGGDGGEGEDAVVQARWVLQVLLQNVPKQLQQLVVVGLEGLRVGLHHFAQ